MRFFAPTAVAVSLIAAPAAAQSFSSPQWTGTIGYSHFVDGSNDEVGAVTARVGARFHPYIGAELEGSIGVTTADVEGYDFKVDRDLGVYLVGYLPMGENFELIGRLGYADTEFDVAGVSVSDGGFSGGIGAQYFFDDHNGIRGDITNHQFSDLDADWDAFSIAYVRRF